MYRFQYTVSEKDVADFSVFHVLNSSAGKKQLLMTRVMALVLAAMFIAFTVYMISAWGFENLSFFEIIIPAFWIAFFFAAKPLLIRGIRKQIMKTGKEGKLPIGESIIQFNEDHILEKTPIAEIKVNYSTVEKIIIADTNKMIYAYYNVATAFQIPFSVFENDAHKEAFLSFLSEKTGKTAVM
jgi:hypothetical protein